MPRLIDAYDSFTLNDCNETGHSLAFGGGFIDVYGPDGKHICQFWAGDAPTIDPESLGLHSRWEYDQMHGVATCKNCGFERNVDDNFGRAISCPNCGAIMDLKEEDDA